MIYCSLQNQICLIFGQTIILLALVAASSRQPELWIELNLALTYHYPVTYAKLVPMSKELYIALLTTDTSDLISVDQFGFSFAASRLKMTEVIKWVMGC